MAEALYLIKRDEAPGEKIIDGVFAVVINSDDAGSDAQKRAEAIAQANAAGHALPANYFDNSTPILLSTASGELADDEDAYVFSVTGSRGVIEKVD